MQFALFAIGLLWLLASRSAAGSAAQGISHALHVDLARPILVQLFLLVLLLTGFPALQWVALREGDVRRTVCLPSRLSSAREWQKGLALGWSLVLLALLPMMLAGDLHPHFDFSGASWLGLVVTALTLLLGALAAEMAFRGFLLERLLRAVGPTLAVVLLALVYAFLVTSPGNNTRYSWLEAVVAGVLFSAAYLRTRAIWFGWGLHFGWLLSMAVFFGLPVNGSADFSSVVFTNSTGPDWLTGGAYGPDGAALTIVVLLLGIGAVYLFTRDYAWEYTHAPIVAGGRPVEVAPPAAHTAMEAASPSSLPSSLVQIQGRTPGGLSAAEPLLPAARPASPPAGLPSEQDE